MKLRRDYWPEYVEIRNTSQQKIIPSKLTKNKFLMREITLSQQLDKSILNNDLI
jgi:hypothetical protein